MEMIKQKSQPPYIESLGFARNVMQDYKTTFISKLFIIIKPDVQLVGCLHKSDLSTPFN